MKNNHETVVLTTLFELEWGVAYKFFDSLNRQYVRDFDILVVNDGFSQLDRIKSIFADLNIVELGTGGTIAKNREVLIRHATKAYKKGIFCDFDDYFSLNRISLSIEELNYHDIVFNDLTIFRNDQVIEKNRFSKDLSNGCVITFNELLQRNYLGLSNTAINLNILDGLELNFDSSLIAVDWYFFSVLLFRGNVAKFTNKATTYYRQHDNNTANIAEFDYLQIMNEIRVKKEHYTQMSKIDCMFSLFLDAIDLFSRDFISNYNDAEDLVFKNNDQAWWSFIKLDVGEA